MFMVFIYLAMTCWIVFVPSPNALLLSFLPSVFVNGAPCALIAKTKSNQSQGREGNTFKGSIFLPMSRYRWEGGSVLEA